MVVELTDTTIELLHSPRAEADSHELEVKHKHLEGFGLKPTTIKKGLIEDIYLIARLRANIAIYSKIIVNSLWNDKVLAALFKSLNNYNNLVFRN